MTDVKALTWQEVILNQFRPKKESMLVVIDPDMLLADETLLAEIQNSSYDILKLEDEVTFRNRFERNYRSKWDAGEPRHVVIIVHTNEKDRHIPFDLLQKGKQIHLSVGELFTNLNGLVVQGLDQAYYQDLFLAHQTLIQRNEMQRGERQTVEFILRTVFEIEPASVIKPMRLVELLIDLHYRGRRIPSSIILYLLEDLSSKCLLLGVTPEIIHHSEAFYSWLNNLWRVFCSIPTSETTFDFNQLRNKTVFTNLFSDGKLDRVEIAETTNSLPTWMNSGIQSKITTKKAEALGSDQMDEESVRARINRFAELKDEELPQGKTDLRDWLNLAAEWSELVFVTNQLPKEQYDFVQPTFQQAREHVNELFFKFIQSRYSAVDFYQDNKGPISLANINSWISQQVSNEDRLALICFDGLALDQWFLLKEHIVSQVTNIDLRENRTFALAPSLTSISRQALFAGRRPDTFPETWDKTNKDGDRWQAYWVNKGVPPKRIAYLPIKSNDSSLETLKEVVDSKNKRLGILINTFDDVMHSCKGYPNTSDKRVFYSSLQGYLNSSNFSQIINILLENGYRIIITSDHGNTSAVGSGITPPKAFIETYARRVAIFGDEALAKEFASNNDIEYFRTKSLPGNLFPVYYRDGRMFNSLNSVEITHGGLSPEELIVPFIEVNRK